MKILDRYLISTVIEATLLALLVLLGVQSFITFIGELSDIGTKDYGISQALLYAALQLPSNIYQFFPMAGLIGSMMGLGRLASRSELIAMRAAGVSISQVMAAVIKAAVLMLIIMTLIGEWLGPHAQQYAEKHKAVAMSGGQALGTQQGVWVRDGDNFIHIGVVMHGGRLQDITRYEFVNHHLVIASHADFGQFYHGQWHFEQVMESHIDTTKVTSRVLPTQVWNVSFDPRLLNLAVVDPEHQSLPKLYAYVRYLKDTDQSSNQSDFVFWKRIFQPLATLVMICLSVPFIFSPLRSTTMGFRILLGVVVGFGFYMLNEFFGPLSMVFQLPPILAAATPAILFTIGGSILVLFAK